MADGLEIFYIGIIVGLFPLIALLMFRWRVYVERDYVCYDMETLEGRTRTGKAKPDTDGVLHLKWGDFFTLPDGFTIVKPYMFSSQEKRSFHYHQLDPFPTKLGFMRQPVPGQVAMNGGTSLAEKASQYEYIAIPQRSVIPPPALKTWGQQHIFGDIYQKNVLMLVLILFGFIILALLVIGLYAPR